MYQELESLPEPALQILLRNCPAPISSQIRLVTHKKDYLICQQDEPANYCFVLLSGKVMASHLTKAGKSYLVATYKRGDVFCYTDIITTSTYMSSAVTLETAKLIYIPRQALLDWLSSDAAFSKYLLMQLAKKFYCSTIKLANTSSPLKYQMLHWLDTKNDKEIAIQKESISEKFGVTLRSVNRILNELEDKGIIRYENNTLRILSSALLKEELDYE